MGNVCRNGTVLEMICFNGISYCDCATLAAPSVSCPGNDSAVIGTAENYTPTNSGGAAASWSATGLPPGMSISSSTGVISGTPTTAGTYNITVTATNATGSNSCSFTVTVAAGLAAPNITCPGNDNATIGTAETYSVTNSGGAIPNGGWTATGLPPGMSINANTGVISGTPTTAGTYNVNVTAANATSSDSCSFTVTVAAACIPASAPSSAFSDSVTEGIGFATPTHGSWIGTGPITLTAAGLPSWATFNPSGGSYTITGTAPTVSATTTFTYSVTGTNACNTGGATLSGNALIVTDSGGGGHGGGCFVYDTQIVMSDGTLKDIGDIKIGEYVMGTDGQPARVTRRHEIEYDADLIGFNGDEPFFTIGHPFLSDTGWVAISPEMARREAPGIEVEMMREGQSIMTTEGSVGIVDIVKVSGKGTIVYNLTVDRHTYIADGFHVHNTTQKF